MGALKSPRLKIEQNTSIVLKPYKLLKSNGFTVQLNFQCTILRTLITLDHELFFLGGTMIAADKVLTDVQLNKFLKRLRVEKNKSFLSLQDSKKRNPKEVRVIIDYYLFALLAQTGLRISEAINLHWDDIHDEFLIVRPEISKNQKKGTVYFGPKTKMLLNELWTHKNGILKRVQTELLFSCTGKVLSRSYAHTRFKYWLSQSSLPNSFSIHSLRHTYGTICLDNGLSLTFVRDQLRHSNISITSQYLHLTKASRDKIKDLF